MIQLLNFSKNIYKLYACSIENDGAGSPIRPQLSLPQSAGRNANLPYNMHILCVNMYFPQYIGLKVLAVYVLVHTAEHRA